MIETARRLLETTLAGGPQRFRTAPAQIDAETRRKLLMAIEACDQAWVAALERVLESMGLSVARRLEARRHLLSPSHRLLTLIALGNWYGLPPQDDGEGLLADDMAAELLRLQRQNFQTTRDHIAGLLQLGLLERRAGRALRVALAESAAAELDSALAVAAEDLAALAASLRGGEADMDKTGISHMPVEPSAARVLVVTREGEPEQRVALGIEPLVIGRAPSAGLMLAAHEVSRAHCRIACLGEAVSVADLEFDQRHLRRWQADHRHGRNAAGLGGSDRALSPALGTGGGRRGHEAGWRCTGCRAARPGAVGRAERNRKIRDFTAG